MKTSLLKNKSLAARLKKQEMKRQFQKPKTDKNEEV